MDKGCILLYKLEVSKLIIISSMELFSFSTELAGFRMVNWSSTYHVVPFNSIQGHLTSLAI